MRRKAVASAVAAFVLWAAPSAVAQEAQEPSSVTLEAVDPRVDYPAPVELRGTTSPPAQGGSVEIWSAEGGLQTIVSTSADGTYSAELLLESNDLLYASWEAVRSEPVEVEIRPAVQVQLKGVRLFGRARVITEVQPALPGGTVRAALFRNGKQVASRVVVAGGNTVKTSMVVPKPGRYHARVTTASPDHAPGRARSRASSTSTPRLGEGSGGPAVKALEQHLLRLNYHLPRADRRYDGKTSDAIRAFNKVQGRARNGFVDDATWRVLASPRIPRPRAQGPRFHIEVDQTKQVLYVVRRGKVTDILHVSTGAGSATRDGVFHVNRKLAGYSANRLYYPSYFDGLRAIHGWPEVPTYNASHGCVRVPMWSAQWIYGLADIGTEIRIYH